MAVINELDEKIKEYYRKREHTLKLRYQVNSLKEEIELVEREINSENNKTLTLKNEEVATVRFGDLLEKLSHWTDIFRKELDVQIIVLGIVFDDTKEDIKCHRGPKEYTFPSQIRITTKDGIVICNQEFSLFKNIDEIQADGKPLIEHCELVEGIYKIKKLIVTKNIDDIICHFPLEAIDYSNYGDDYQSRIFPRTIRKCITEGFTIDTEEKNKGRQYTRKR